MPIFESIKRRAAQSIASVYFDSAVFMPRGGNEISCDATLISEVDQQPVGYDSITDVKQDTVIYRKEQISDSLVEPGAYFIIDEIKYIIDSVSSNDGEVFGHVVVRNED